MFGSGYFGAPQFGQGALTVQLTLILPFINSAEQLYAPTLVPGPVTLTLPFVPSGEQMYAPVVAHVPRRPIAIFSVKKL